MLIFTVLSAHLLGSCQLLRLLSQR